MAHHRVSQRNARKREWRALPQWRAIGDENSNGRKKAALAASSQMAHAKLSAPGAMASA